MERIKANIVWDSPAKVMPRVDVKKEIKNCKVFLDGVSMVGFYYGSAKLGETKPVKKGAGIFIFRCEGHTILMTRPYLERVLDRYKRL